MTEDIASTTDTLPDGLKMPGSSHLPLIPQPGRRASDEAQIPFDPSGFQVLRQLEEVEKKPEPAQGVLTAGQIADARRKAKFVPKFSSLESMYAANPEVVTSGRLRIERIQPQWYDDEYGQKMRVSGVIAFKHPIIGDENFAQKFGGFKYRVFSLLDQENRENRGGPPQSTEVAVAEFEIPLPPNVMNLPVADVEMPVDMQGAPDMYGPQYAPPYGSPYGRRSVPGMQYPGQGQPDYNPFLSLAERALTRNQENLPSAAWDVIGRANDTAVQGIRATSERQVELLADQVRRLEAQLEAERQRGYEVQRRPTEMAEMVDGMSRLVASTKGNTDSDVIRQMRDDHDRAISRISQENEQKLRRVSEEFERSSARMKEDADRALAREREYAELRMRASEARVKDLEAQLAAKEREGKDEAERREARAREDAERSMQIREREHAQRIEYLQSQHDREIANVRSMHDRELRLLESVEKNTRTTGDQAHGIELRAAKDDAHKATAELSLLREKLKDLEAERNKPLLQQVEDLHRTTEAIQEIAGGMGDEKDLDEPKNNKWYDSPLVRDIGRALVAEGAQHLPALAKSMKAAKNLPAGPVVPPDALGPRRQVPPVMRQAAGLPPRRTKKVTFADSDGPRFADASHLRAPDRRGDVSRSRAAPRPFSPDGPASYDAADMGVRPSSYVPQPPAPSQSPPPQPSRPSAQPPAPSAQPPAMSAEQEDWSDFSWLPMNENDVKVFVMQLNWALENQGDASKLADAFLENYPPDVIRQLVNTLDMRRLIETIRSSPTTNHLTLASGKGRRFLADTWEILAQSLAPQAHRSSPPPASRPPLSQDPANATEPGVAGDVLDTAGMDDLPDEPFEEDA